MTPDLSRKLGRILGSHWLTPGEREQVIAAAQPAATWQDLPADIQALLDDIGTRPAWQAKPDGGRR